MGLVVRNKSGEIVAKEGPHYFRVTLPEQEFGALTRDCGSQRDVDSILALYPGSTVEKVFLPVIKDPIDVSSVSLEPDPALPESNQQPFNP